jgi:hypothetical protein
MSDASGTTEPTNAMTGVVILGVWRSGTSLVGQVAAELGVDFGPEEGMGRTDQYNPGGYFERIDVVHLNARLLETAGRSFGNPGDPATLAKHADPGVWHEADLDWMKSAAVWGLKDPRMCATLNAWLSFGWMKPEGLRIVRVERDFDAIVRSAVRYPNVAKHYAHNEDAIRAGAHEFDRLAEWQLEHLDAPVHRLRYEDMIAEPRRQSERLAAFLDVHDQRMIRRAAGQIGKRKAQFRWLEERVVRKLKRLVGKRS